MSRKNLTVSEERFAQEFVKHRNGAQAFRDAFPQLGRNSDDPNFAAKKGSELRSRPEVQGRINELIAEAAEGAVMSAREVLNRWLAIALADPRELVEVRKGCCRYCFGVGFNYQWREREIVEMIQQTDKRNERLKNEGMREDYADVSGGDGFQEFREPNPECPECGGEGHPRVLFKDTRNLSPEAMLLYGGAKMGKNGMEVIVASREKAFENVTRILGLFNDNVKLTGNLTTMSQIIEITTDNPEVAAEQYQKMIANMAT